ncbi:MAG: peptidoglycan DD-metalloendopeptidase family protein [Solirubrobacterales bacterium]|nr:peptidoglycan DD-metalloendopeptidase family protein [Solirubrobacterales bacterium]
MRGLRVGGLVAAALAFALLCVGAALPAGAAQTETTALQLQIPGAPQRVHGSDGREHIDYDLVITNEFSAAVELTRVTVRGDGRELLTLSGPELTDATHQTQAGEPTTTIPASSVVATLVDVVLPRSAGRTVPKRIHTRIDYALPAEAPLIAAIDSTVVSRTSRVERRRPIEVAAPLRGSGWLTGNGCCGDPSSPHRNLLLAANGRYVTPEIFAIDFIRVVGGRLYEGDGTQNTDHFSYGTPIHAAAAGTVVTAVDDRPEVPPGQSAVGNPTVHKSADFGGNHVVVRIAPGTYAAYVHMQTGSIRVKRGQRVRTGQVIGRLGNSGNTTAPHLHFGIQDGPSLSTSNSLPFEIDHFRLQGTAGPGPTPAELTVTDTKRKEHRSYPLTPAVASYWR